MRMDAVKFHHRHTPYPLREVVIIESVIGLT